MYDYFLSGLSMTETGLPGLLFGLLDTETDCVLVRHVHHTLTSMLQALATSHLNMWLTLCQEVLTSTTGKMQSVMQVSIWFGLHYHLYCSLCLKQ